MKISNSGLRFFSHGEGLDYLMHLRGRHLTLYYKASTQREIDGVIDIHTDVEGLFLHSAFATGFESIYKRLSVGKDKCVRMMIDVVFIHQAMAELYWNLKVQRIIHGLDSIPITDLGEVDYGVQGN